MKITWEFILTSVACCAWQWGFNYTFLTGEIFGPIGDWGRRNLNANVIKPIYDCPYCMSSIHGTAFFIVFLSGYPWWMWPVFCFSVCGWVAITDKK